MSACELLSYLYKACSGEIMLRRVLEEPLEKLKTEGALPTDFSLSRVQCDVPPEGMEGDIATNAAFVLAKPLKQSPRDIAIILKTHFEKHPAVQAVHIAGAGFLNLTLTPTFWHGILKNVLAAQGAYGKGTWGARCRVNVEYVSVNPTGPLHIGHGRVAVVGDVVANLLSTSGFDVTREYYVNDAGEQVATLARSLHLRYREAHGERMTIPAGCYPGDYLIPVAEALKNAEGDRWLQVPEAEWMPVFCKFAVAHLMNVIKKSLATLGIHQDVFTSEKALYERGVAEQALRVLHQKNLIYTGTLPPPKGKNVQDWKPEPLTLFKATALGEAQDVALKKSDGQYTYFAGDVAYHKDKLDRGFDWLINVWGADHAGHVGRLKASVKALSDKDVQLDFILSQMVRVVKDGAEMKLSKRAGNMEYLDDVVEACGADVLRFLMVARSVDTHLTLDMDAVRETSKENPVFYVHYAYARGCSVKRAAQELWGDKIKSLQEAKWEKLARSSEQKLIQKMAFWPLCVKAAAEALEPHRIVTFLYDLSAHFHALWSEGAKDTTLRFLQEKDAELSIARLALIQGMIYILEEGLGILGVTPRETLTW